MNKVKSQVILFIFLGIFCFMKSPILSAKTYEITSPDTKIKVRIEIGSTITYSIFVSSQEVLMPSTLSLEIDEQKVLGENPKVVNVQRRRIDETITPVVAEKRSTIKDFGNELVLTFESNYKLVFRAYDDGVAYRFITNLRGDMHVFAENVLINFAKDYHIYFPEEESFLTHSERLYRYLKLSEISPNQMCSMPALVECENGLKIAITEADLYDYPGLYLTGSEGSAPTLRGIFPAYPLKEEQTRDRTIEVADRAEYIAATQGTRSFPWRVFLIAEKDGDLIESDLVFRLAPKQKLRDTSWIRPGKVAWDWWNANNVFGVDFTSGINTETYKYYIDFAAEFNIEYIILDEGWSDTEDLLEINPDINMPELLEYARQKNVGIILWAVWCTLEEQLHEALDTFQKWGVKGIKVDFMQRDDQKMVNYYSTIAEEAAKRQLLVDFHGSYKPTGLRRSYPNVLTREGVKGLENCKWSDVITPAHDVTLPFIRMLAGPMDFTPGAMNNAQKKNYNISFERPMSLGTRVHQLAMYVVYESPLQMLCDSPSQYLREPEIMRFLGPVPTTWDETIVLDAKAAEYVLIARKHGDEWYIGAMTNWTPRELAIDFRFLGEGTFTADIFMDGPNAARYASDYSCKMIKVSAEDTMQIELAPGGGWVARIF